MSRSPKSGSPRVHVGSGSMTGADHERTLTTVLRALGLSHQRGMLLSGWAGLVEGRALPEYAYAAQGVAYRRPTPFVADQPGWARRVEELGIGAASLPEAFPLGNPCLFRRQGVSDGQPRETRPPPERPHSYLSASTGSIFAALLAG